MVRQRFATPQHRNTATPQHRNTALEPYAAYIGEGETIAKAEVPKIPGSTV